MSPSRESNDFYANGLTPEEANTRGVIKQVGREFADRVNNPLSTIQLGLQLLTEQGNLPPESLEVIKMIQESALNIENLVKDAQNPVRVVRRQTPLGPAIDIAASAQPGPLRPQS